MKYTVTLTASAFLGGEIQINADNHHQAELAALRFARSRCVEWKDYGTDPDSIRAISVESVDPLEPDRDLSDHHAQLDREEEERNADPTAPAPPLAICGHRRIVSDRDDLCDNPECPNYIPF